MCSIDITTKSIPPVIEWSLGKFFRSSEGTTSHGGISLFEGDLVKVIVLYLMEKTIQEGKYYITLKLQKNQEIHKVILSTKDKTVDLIKFHGKERFIEKDAVISLYGTYTTSNHGYLIIKTGDVDIEKKIFFHLPAFQGYLKIEDDGSIIEVKDCPSSFITNVKTLADTDHHSAVLYQCHEEVARSNCTKFKIKRPCLIVCGQIKHKIPLCICSTTCKGPFPGTFLIKGMVTPLSNIATSKIKFHIKLEHHLTYPKRIRYKILSKGCLIDSGQFSLRCEHKISIIKNRIIDEATIIFEWNHEVIDWETGKVVCVIKKHHEESITITTCQHKPNLNVYLDAIPHGEDVFWLDPDNYSLGLPYTLWNNEPNPDMIRNLFKNGLFLSKEAIFQYLITWGKSNATHIIHTLKSSYYNHESISEQHIVIPY